MTAQPTRATITLSADWQPKGELLMEGLAEEIGALWRTFSQIQAQPVPGGHLEIGNLNLVLNALRRTLTTIRSLDGEVFMGSDETGYTAVREKDPQGVAVRGLVGPRNNAVHHPEVVDPDVHRAVGPLDNGRFLIYPRWRVRDASLDAMFSFKGKFKQSYADAYDQALSGRVLLDPILDAFAFFERLAPGLALRDEEGQLVGFPLEPLPEGLGYKRLSPSWPTEAERDAALRARLVDSLPGGTEREIRGFFRTADGDIVLAGMTTVAPNRGQSFVELSDQVARDIAAGYPYRVAPTGVNAGGLINADLTLPDGSSVLDSGLPDDTDATAEPWAGWWQLCQEAAYYRTMRTPT